MKTPVKASHAGTDGCRPLSRFVAGARGCGLLVKALKGLRIRNRELERLLQERAAALKREADGRRRGGTPLPRTLKEWELIFDCLPDLIAIIDNNYRIIRANGAMARRLGVSREECVGLLCYRSVHGTSRPPAFCPHAMTLADGREHSAEVHEERLGGDFLVTTTPLEDDSGVMVGAVHVAREITERKRAEEALKESEAKYRAIVDAFEGFIYTCSADYRIEFMNNRLIERTGRNATGELCYKALHDLDSSCPWCVNGKVQRGETARWEIKSPKDGRWYYVVNTPIFHADGSISKQAMIIDITGRKQAEEEILRFNESLERTVEERTRQLVEAQEELIRKEKLATIGLLAGSVGHELRNPLGVMTNAVFFLKTVMADADETVKEYLNIIKQEIDNSQLIISDLLDFSRVKPPRIRTVPVRELINKTLGRCAIPENIKLHMELPDTLPLLRVDPLQIGQVLQNLVINALQAMPEGGAVRISARRVEGSKFEVQGSEAQNVERRTLNVGPAGDFVEISIEDTGEGIAPENMHKLFQPLFTTKARGIGLGLVVCKNLTEANGGAITVVSRLGEGTTFSLTLPTEAKEKHP